MSEAWIAGNWTQLLTLVSVVIFAIRTQMNAQQADARSKTLGDKLDALADRTTAKINELEKQLAQMMPRQRDVERLERDNETLERKVSRLGERLAALEERRRTHDDLDRESGEGKERP